MDRTATKKLIIAHEGTRTSVYKDEKQHPTIGIGFNLDRQDARSKIEGLGVSYEEVLSGKQALTNEQVNQLFDSDFEEAIKDAQSLIKNFESLPEKKQAVLVDMVFNLGKQGFAKFEKAIKAIEKEDWHTAANEMENSLWYRQTKLRGSENVKTIRE